MKTNSLISALAAIAAQNPSGYTVDAHSLLPVTAGYAVAVADTQNSFGTEGLKAVVEFVRRTPDVNAFGGWRDESTGLFYYDAVIIVDDLNKALEIAREHQQIAFFDLANLTEIRL